MFPSDDAAETKMSMAEADSTSMTNPSIVATTTIARSQDTKDAGRVRVGAGMMQFTKDAGRVRVGAGMMRF